MDTPLLELTFTDDVWTWRGPAPYHFVTVPDELSSVIRALSGIVTYGWGMIPVQASIGDTAWTTALWPKDGRYVVPLKDAVRRAEALAPGDTVTVRLAIRQ
jgi:hypothetical protein